MRLLTFIFIWLSFTALGQIPEGYYNSAEGITGQELRAALKEIIDDHDAQSYSSIWTHFTSTDPDENGNVWDMYSDIPGGNPEYTDLIWNTSSGIQDPEIQSIKGWITANDLESYTISDLSGRIMAEGNVNGKGLQLPSSLKTGIYILFLKGESTVSCHKIFIAAKRY